MSRNQLSESEKITAKNIPAYEPLASGHRACQGCGEILALRLALKAAGEDVIVLNATGCMEVVTSPYPQTAWNVPWLHVAFENAAAVGSGVEAARKAMARKGRLSDNRTKIMVVAGDGGTSDIGMQALSGALERGHDFVYLCLDNEAYMNTGIQRSSATPWGSWTTTSPTGRLSSGKATTKKDLPAIAAAHSVPYVATASPAYHLDLMNKVKKAVMTPGAAFVHIFSPCPTGWRMATQFAVKVAKLAVQTKAYPLYEVIEGKYVLSRKIAKPKPVSEYLKIQGRFRHLTDEEIRAIQTQVDRRYADLEWLASRDNQI
jgi:pyruvate ferredoxin oxidoreductase beta subunit